MEPSTKQPRPNVEEKEDSWIMLPVIMQMVGAYLTSQDLPGILCINQAAKEWPLYIPMVILTSSVLTNLSKLQSPTMGKMLQYCPTVIIYVNLRQDRFHRTHISEINEHIKSTVKNLIFVFECDRSFPFPFSFIDGCEMLETLIIMGNTHDGSDNELLVPSPIEQLFSRICSRLEGVPNIQYLAVHNIAVNDLAQCHILDFQHDPAPFNESCISAPGQSQSLSWEVDITEMQLPGNQRWSAIPYIKLEREISYQGFSIDLNAQWRNRYLQKCHLKWKKLDEVLFAELLSLVSDPPVLVRQNAFMLEGFG